MAGKHGGKRSGSGRKMSVERKAQLEAAEKVRAKLAKDDGETPLEYMLRVMRDADADTKRRDQMALGAAQYLHPKLQAVEHGGNEDKPLAFHIISGVTRDEEEDQRPPLNGPANGSYVNGSH